MNSRPSASAGIVEPQKATLRDGWPESHVPAATVHRIRRAAEMRGSVIQGVGFLGSEMAETSVVIRMDPRDAITRRHLQLLVDTSGMPPY